MKNTKSNAIEMAFYNEGRRIIAKMRRFNDAFYEIVEGRYKGNLVHIWDIAE